MYVALAALAMSFTSGTPTHAPTPPSAAQENNLLWYTWYWDDEGTQPVGTQGPVGQEIARLQTLYPNNSWSSNPFSGSHQYEYGFYAYYMQAIWTNKPY